MNYSMTMHPEEYDTKGYSSRVSFMEHSHGVPLTTYQKVADIVENDVIKHYGLTQSDFDFVNLKIKSQTEFLNSHYLFNSLTHSKIFLSEFIVSSSHNADRYHALILNRVNTLNKIAKKENLVPLFLTLTLPSRFHPKKQKSRYDKTLIDNPKYNGISIKEANQILTKRFKKLRDDRAYRGSKKIYFRVVEPHQDGTPHTHILLFVQKDRVEKMVEAFKRIYPSQTNKIETDIRSGVAYLMKYLNKTLPLSKRKNLSEKEKYLNAWYASNRIVRFSSSRTLAPLKIYRLLYQKFDLLGLTYAVKNNQIEVITDGETDKILKIIRDGELLYEKNRNIELRSIGTNYLKDNFSTENNSSLEVA